MPIPLAVSTSNLASYTLDGLNIISILVVVALGLGVILGLMGVINLAHGAFLAVGAYATYAVVHAGVSFWVALAAAPLVGAIIGLGVERSMIQFLYRRPLDTVLATWGLALIVQQLLQVIFGTSPKGLNPPLAGQAHLFGISYPSYRLFTIGASLALSVLAFAWLYRTAFGLRIRAIIQDREIAGAVGIDIKRVNALAFALGTAFAAFAGGLLAGQTGLTPDMGLPYLAPAFLVVLVGGQGSMVGLVAAAAVLGVAQEAFNQAITPVVSQAVTLGIAVCLARARPAGIFGAAR
jgi:urea transport system permease protein